MIKSFSIFPRLLSLVATMTLGSMAFADAPIPEVSITNSLGSSQSYTIKVTDAPSATGYAGAGTDGTIYVLADQAYTFNIKATEGSNYNIAIREVDASGNDNMGNVNGSQDGAGPDTTYIEDITRTFPTPGTKVIARAYYFYGAGFTRAAYLLGATVDPAVQIVDVTVTIIKVDLEIEIRDEEPDTDPRAAVRDASGLDMSTLSVTLNGNAVGTSIMTITDISSGSLLVGKNLQFTAPCSMLNLLGSNEVKANISDNAGNAMDEVTQSFVLP